VTNQPFVGIVEVAPRDGLQSDALTVATSLKVELIERLAAAGLRRIEAASFVSPTRVPQMADAADVMAALDPQRSWSAIGLVLNGRGFERALAAGVDEINVVVVASDTFCLRNQAVSTEGSVQVWREVAASAREHGLRTTVIVATAFGCPFEGEVPLSRLADVVASVAEQHPDEIALADTIGVAVPTDVRRRVEVARDAAPGVALRCHFHNTRNTGLANAVAAVEAGVTTIDASVGGIGGCPFAPRATGNIPTEDLVYLLERSGFATGVSLEALIETTTWLEGVLGCTTPGMLAKAGPFPGPRSAPSVSAL